MALGDNFGTTFPVYEVDFDESPTGDLTTVVPMLQLLGGTRQFDRITLSATEAFDAGTVITIRDLSLIEGEPDLTLQLSSKEDAAATVDCAATPIPISPHVYGVARSSDRSDQAPWEIPVPSRRWGGNPTSRYNPVTGNWNTANDYFWENVVVGDADLAHEEFLRDNWAHDVGSAVTVPMLGWVAKDDVSVSFPASKFPDQESFDGYRPEAGNGVTSDGEQIQPLSPSMTSVEWTSDDATNWVRAMVAESDAAGHPRPFLYFLDNEPMLWNSTHRDVFPQPLGYDELLRRSIEFATAIKRADPEAMVAGPSVWGWPAYFYSAIDALDGYESGSDYITHGRTPLLEWYLAEMRKYEERTGVRLLDVLDVHFYPQDGSYGSDVSPEASERRIRSTRSLWIRATRRNPGSMSGSLSSRDCRTRYRHELPGHEAVDRRVFVRRRTGLERWYR